MANSKVNPRLCGVAITCAGTDSPIINTSAENSDGPEFLSLRWPSIDPSQLPYPIAQNFVGNNCLTVCNSTVSQSDADLCAERAAFLCQHTDPKTGRLSGTVAGNSPQSYTVHCPDGSPFTFTTPAGAFFAFSETQANKQAKGYAQQQAALHMICLGTIPTTYDIGATVNQPVSASGNLSPIPYSDFWELIGDLPNGLNFAGSGDSGFFNHALDGFPQIFGTVTGTGTFTFLIKITNWIGDTMSKQFTITVATRSVTPDIFSNTIAYFSANSSAGTYRVNYVNGALRKSPTLGFTMWQYFVFFSSGSTAFPNIAGDTSFNVGNTQAKVEAQNSGSVFNFTHTGGPIGVWFSDSAYGDNIAGSPNPTFTLTKIS